MPFLCVPGWDIYVFSHKSSETIKNIWFQSVCSVGWLFWAKKHFFCFWSLLVQIIQKWSQMVKNCQTPLLDHLGPFLSDLDQFGPKMEKMGFSPKVANPQSKSHILTDFGHSWAPTPTGPIFLAQNFLYICPRHRSICFMLNSHL